MHCFHALIHVYLQHKSTEAMCAALCAASFLRAAMCCGPALRLVRAILLLQQLLLDVEWGAGARWGARGSPTIWFQEAQQEQQSEEAQPAPPHGCTSPGLPPLFLTVLLWFISLLGCVCA